MPVHPSTRRRSWLSRSFTFKAVLALQLIATSLLGQESEKTAIRLNVVGVTGSSFGAWVPPGATVEQWLDQARGLCSGEQYCQVNVFEGPGLATHEEPVPDDNRVALRWVFLYEQDADPAIVVEAAQAGSDGKKQRWTYDADGKRTNANEEGRR